MCMGDGLLTYWLLGPACGGIMRLRSGWRGLLQWSLFFETRQSAVLLAAYRRPIGTHWDLWGPIGTYGDPLGPMGTHGDL